MSTGSRQRRAPRAAEEINLFASSHTRALLRICLVYPNRYRTGMSSLGFQTAYRLFGSFPGICCERAFLPDDDRLTRNEAPILSLEQRRPLADFDLVAFSVSFEPDYVTLAAMLRRSRIPLYSRDRNASHPLIMAGGSALFINPEPVADFLDLICIGEGEEIIPALLERLLTPGPTERPELLAELARLPGVYVPRFYTPRSESGVFRGFEVEDGIPVSVERVCADLDRHPPAQSVILSDQTEFGDMFLVEVSRSCPRGCRFCSSGFVYGAFRQHRLAPLMEAVSKGLEHRDKIGLVGAAVSDYNQIGALCRHIVAQGGRVSVSSLRIDRLDPEMLEALVVSGHKTISLAPEGGSQRLRDLIRKNLTEKQILEACELITAHDILNLKLYFIIGLPEEEEADLEELARLALTIRERVVERARANGRLGEITLSVNPFIPKPFTPFQWCGMEALPSLERKVKFLEQRFRGVANLQLKVESLKSAYLQALLSRGDRRCAPLLELLASGSSLKQAAKAIDMDTDALVQRAIPLDAPLPWALLGSADQELLKKEYERAFDASNEHSSQLF